MSTATRPGMPMQRRGPGPFGSPIGMPVEKASDVRGTVRRMLARLAPEKGRLALGRRRWRSRPSAARSPARSCSGTPPTSSSRASWARSCRPASPRSRWSRGLRAQGRTTQADLVNALDVVPGQGVDFAQLQHALLVVLAVYLLASLFAWAQGWIMAGVTQRVVFAIRQEADRKIGRLPLAYVDRHARGDLLSRVTNDIDNINTTLQQTLTQSITAITTVVAVLGVMIWISPLLALVALVTVPVSIVGTLLIARRAQPHFASQWRWTGRLNGHVEEMFSGHDVVKVYGRQAHAERVFDEANGELYEASFKAQFISGVVMPAMTLVGNLGYVAIAVIGGLQVASGQLPIGDVQAFIQYSRQFTMPITQLASLANLVQSGIASAERVFALLDETEEEPDPAEPSRLGRLAGHVRFEHVSFRYDPETPLIEDLSLDARPGQTVAIVGPTGAGKTTLVNLLLRFYEIDGGRITLDGVDVRELTRDDLRHSFGMVLQDAWLFGGTIRDNIAYGAAGATDQQIRRAAEAAEVDHFVRTLPDGYDTVLEDDASNVSAGQRQLVTIARAFLADPPVLVLDEATSSVDTRTEVLIQQAMARLRAGRTGFVIAHRLSTIRNADLILVLEHGAVVERGTHDELLARGGAYHALYTSQFAEPASVAEAEAGAGAGAGAEGATMGR